LDTEKCLKWSMLWPSSSHCINTCDPPNRLWLQNRNEPATNPRLGWVRIVSPSFPLVFIIKAANEDAGVTCGEVIDGIDDFLHGTMTKKEFDDVDIRRKKDTTTAYHINRSTADGVGFAVTLHHALALIVITCVRS
jgi:hypothetical protein